LTHAVPDIAKEKGAKSMTAMLGDLPTWNLSDLYSSPTGPDLDADLKRAAAEAEAFARDYEGKVAGLDGKALGGAIARYEKMSDLMGRIGSSPVLRAEHGRSRARPLFGRVQA
jgi:oligoendopeptidase F